MSGERVFLDTNILIYAYDRETVRKHEVARDLLIDLWNGGGGVLSAQILGEFYVTVTKKITHPVSPATAREIVMNLATWDVVAIDGESVLEAIDLQSREKISFWDALVVVAAIKGGAEILLSEDFSDGRKFGPLAVRNPFARRAKTASE
jgi:predicted nucleic acid-binding protein